MKTARGRGRKTPGYLYIMTNKMRNVLYTGVTADLRRRIGQHRNGEGSVFTQRYRVKYLVYYEEYESIMEAIEREKEIKKWHRPWKLRLIHNLNPGMRDLWHDL